MEPGKLRSSARGRGAGASRVVRKGIRRKQGGELPEPPELEDVGWESPSVPENTDSKLTLKIEPSVSQRPTRASSSKPFWENLPRTVCPCSQPVVAQRLLNNNTFETDDLNLLMDELRQRRIDARERALALETALRKLWKEKGLTLEREPFYIGAQKWLHEPFPPEDAKETPRDEARNDSDDSDVPLSRVADGEDEERKKKKLRKTPTANIKKKKKAEGSDDELLEEPKVEVPKDTNKPLRAQQFWAEVDQFFEYPDEESVKLLQTTSWSDDEASKIAPCGRSNKESEEDIIEIGGDDEDPAKKGALGGASPAPKGKKKKLTLKKLCLARSDPKIKKSILETDRVLRGESELLTSVLSQRTLSAVVDVPYPTPKSHVQSCLPEPPSDGSPHSPKRSLSKKPNSTMEERLLMELRYLGVIPDDFEEVDELTREDDEICIELRALQQSLKETAAQNNRIKAETFEACSATLGMSKALKQIKEGHKACEKSYQKIKKKYSGVALAEKKRHQIDKTLASVQLVEQETSSKNLPLFRPHPRDMYGFPHNFWNEYLVTPNPYCSTLEDTQRRTAFGSLGLGS